MLARTEGTPLPSKVSELIRSTAARLEEDYPSERPMVGYADAADICTAAEQTIRAWRSLGYLPWEKRGRFIVFAVEDLKIINELRATHGRDWHNFVPWEKPCGRELTESSVDADDLLTQVCERVIKKAKEARDAGNHEAAYQLLWIFVDTVEEMSR